MQTMVSRILGLNSQTAEDEEIGSISWDGSEFILDPPDSVILNNILNSGVTDWKSKSIITKKEPELFLRSLKKKYKSAYLRATDVDEDHQPVKQQEVPSNELASKEKPDSQKVSQSSSREQLDRRARLIADILGNTLIPAEIDQILDSEAKPKSST